ncbi:MAG: hypothetical protein FWE08_03525 [Oscillospiraceae bacterium]|nr:hypothetical protein [Oscillospiraceae bacterium]
MKKIVMLVLVVLLLVPGFAACTDRGDDAAAYRELEQAFRHMDAATVNHEVEVDFLTASSDVIRFSERGTMAVELGEMQIVTTYYDEDGSPIFDTEFILADGRSYVGIVRTLDRQLEMMADEFGVTAPSAAEVLGDYTHVQVPDGELEDMFEDAAGFADTFAEADLSDFLTRDGDRFVIAVKGESVAAHIDGVVGEIGLQTLFATAAVLELSPAVLDAIFDFPGWLHDSDFSEAALTITRSQTADTPRTFYRSIALYIPGRVNITSEAAFVVEDVPLVLSPAHVLSNEDFEERMMGVMMELMMGDTRGRVPEDLEIVRDLEGVSLLGHDLAGSRFFNWRLIMNPAGHVMVTVMGGEIIETGLSQSESEAIVFFYSIMMPPGNAVDGLLPVEPFTGTLPVYGEFTAGSPLWTDEDDSVAVWAMGTAHRDVRELTIFMVEEVPDEDIRVALTIHLYLSLFEADDYLILAELGEHIGIDFAAYIDMLF